MCLQVAGCVLQAGFLAAVFNLWGSFGGALKNETPLRILDEHGANLAHTQSTGWEIFGLV